MISGEMWPDPLAPMEEEEGIRALAVTPVCADDDMAGAGLQTCTRLGPRVQVRVGVGAGIRVRIGVGARVRVSRRRGGRKRTDL